MKPNLQDLLDFVESEYRLDSVSLALLPDLNAKQASMFKIRHVLLHMCKQTGTFAGACERFEHTGEVSIDDELQMRVAVAKMLINVLFAAKELGMSGDDIETLMRDVFTGNRERVTEGAP